MAAIKTALIKVEHPAEYGPERLLTWINNLVTPRGEARALEYIDLNLDAGSGMVRTVIDLPIPPVPYERVSLRKVSQGDWFIEKYDGIWVLAAVGAGAVGEYRICLDLPAPKVMFPASVPGFKKGTWFARYQSGGWVVSDGELRICVNQVPGAGQWLNDRDAGNSAYFIHKNATAHNLLNTLGNIPWDQCCFQTTEDG